MTIKLLVSCPQWDWQSHEFACTLQGVRDKGEWRLPKNGATLSDVLTTHICVGHRYIGKVNAFASRYPLFTMSGYDYLFELEVVRM
jgi:hypothetical protein